MYVDGFDHIVHQQFSIRTMFAAKRGSADSEEDVDISVRLRSRVSWIFGWLAGQKNFGLLRVQMSNNQLLVVPELYRSIVANLFTVWVREISYVELTYYFKYWFYALEDASIVEQLLLLR
jgi:hypothetical protein